MKYSKTISCSKKPERNVLELVYMVIVNVISKEYFFEKDISITRIRK